jgi:CBS domain-containing protein
MRVEDACRPGLFTVDIDDSLEVAARRMDQAQLGALAVVDGQWLDGIVTERGLVRAIARSVDPADVPVRRMRCPPADGQCRAGRQGSRPAHARPGGSPPSDDKSRGQLIGMVAMRDLLAAEA